MEFIRNHNPFTAFNERVAGVKELLGPKVTLFLVRDPQKGEIWVEDPGVLPVLARGLATFASKDKDIGFLSIKVGRETHAKRIIHLFRDHGVSITSMTDNVRGEYHPIEKFWHTATMIPIALMYGEAWKHLG